MTLRSVTNSVAVVIPHVRFPLSEDEKVSLRHLRTYLGQYDCFLIGPRALPSEVEDLKLLDFPSHFFSSIHSYCELLTSQLFYKAFIRYQYILIYQLDSLVFSSDIQQWCDKGWDYVGAPWFKGYEAEDGQGFWRVGNGGLSLRNVQNSLRVLRSRHLCSDPKLLGMRTRYIGAPALIRKSIQSVKTMLHSLGYKNSVKYFIEQMAHDDWFHEDHFWSLYSQLFLPEFRIPSSGEAVQFAFECSPRYCFNVTGERLPFGCHAWGRYDRKFWEPFLLK